MRMEQALPVAIAAKPEWELRHGPITHDHLGRTQHLYINASELRRRVKQDGYTFDDTSDYLRKYHGLKNFAILEISRLGPEIVLRIRRIGVMERLRNRLRSL